MLDTNPVPTLSLDAWVNSTELKCDYLLSHFIVSEYSRTLVYYQKISSLPWLIQKYKNDMNGLENAVRNQLSRYFGKYFPKVEVQVQVKLEEGSKYAIVMVVIVTDVDGKEFSLAKVADIVDSKVVHIAKLNNYGTAE